ncbi:hypothetical protein ACLF3G_27505 [Falsiroseomonas sp. HC035]|uniref:hypothetical protein n=1 Tax=Falsiroseomonas sp. HC035 TaxID=3390999 RepID=UPI003D30FF3A
MEATAAILAAVAWPDELPDGERLARAQAALVGHLLQETANADPAWAWRPQLIKPGYLLMEPKQAALSLKTTSKRLTEALTVARVARPFVAKVLTGVAPPLPKGVMRLSLNAVIPKVLSEYEDQHNFEQRVFRRTLPVLHLALALELAIGAAEETAGRSPGLEELLISDDLPGWLIGRAEALETAVLSIRQFAVPAERQLRVRLGG